MLFSRQAVVFMLMLAALTVIWQPVKAQDLTNLDMSDADAVMNELLDMFVTRNIEPEIFVMMGESGDPRYIAPLLDIGYFLRGSEGSIVINAALARLTGLSETSDWTDFFVWAGENDVTLPPRYDEFKGQFLGAVVDPDFAQFFRPGTQETARVNMVEAVWGGVVVDGIPSLVNAAQITPEEAAAEGEALTEFCRGDDCRYPAPDELVFGVYLNGDARAYPLRLLNWHEMFNDVIGHTPMLDAPNGDRICDFRAPTVFDALARSGDDFVLVNGQSAGCPEQGWLVVDALTWDADLTWNDVRANLPDVAAGEDPLAGDDDDDNNVHRGSVMGTPVMLAYCTLCGSGILYDVTLPALTYTNLDGETVELEDNVLEFGSTGLLMRSNKLMYDRNTNTVWNALTGEPAFGPLATTDIVLDLLPVVVIDWQTWLEQHPDTSVLSLDTGFRRDYSNGGAYEDYFNDPNFVMFPVWQQDETQNANKDMIFGLRVGGVQKAYPLATIIPEGVTNDTVAGEDIVLVTDATPDRDFFEPGGAAVRAYERGDYDFTPGENALEVIDQNGAVWQVTEDALISEDGATLARIPGHLAFWFGWYGFYPDTLLYEGA